MASKFGRKGINWDRHIDILGVLSDNEIGRRFGVLGETVRKIRVHRHIPAANPSWCLAPAVTELVSPLLLEITLEAVGRNTVTFADIREHVLETYGRVSDRHIRRAVRTLVARNTLRRPTLGYYVRVKGAK